jgi:hypothetical protein
MFFSSQQFQEEDLPSIDLVNGEKNRDWRAHTWNKYDVIIYRLFSYKCICYCYFFLASVNVDSFTDLKSKVFILDNSAVDAEHAVRTRLDVEKEYELSAQLDLFFFTFRTLPFKQCKLRDYFNNFSEDSIFKHERDTSEIVVWLMCL